MFAEAVGIRDRLAVLVDRLDPDAFSGLAARELWGVLDASERLCAAGKTLLARRVAETHRPEQRGTKTAAEDLARRSGTSTGAAKDAVNTSQRLPEQPRVDAALRRGELSPAQAVAISSAVAANSAEEARLVELASRVSLAELCEECARVRAATDPNPEATNRRLHAARRLSRWIDAEGFWNLHAKGTPQAGAVFNAVLDPIIDRIFKAARAQGRREHSDAYAFDALMHLADHATGHCDCQADAAEAHGAEAAAGPDAARADATRADVAAADAASGAEATEAVGVDTAGPSAAAAPVDRDGRPDTPVVAGDPGIFAAFAGRVGPGSAPESGCAVTPRSSSSPRYLALLRVDVAALRRGHVQGGELCEVAGVGPVPVSVAKEVLGEAIVKLVITDGVDVANVTHLGRGPTAAQRAALLWLNPTCSVEGCHRRRIEWDHSLPWAQTRHTRLDELDPLCGFHHDLKTRLGYALIAGTGKRPFLAPDDPRHPRTQHRANGGAPTSAGTGRTASKGPPAQARPLRGTVTPAPAPPGKPSRVRTARPAGGAQMTLPEPPAKPAPQPP